MAEIIQNKKQATNPTPKELIFKYLPYLPWVLLSLLLFLVGAFIKLRYSAPMYNVTGKILVKDKNPYGSGSDKFNNILMMPDNGSNLNNEIEIIKSRSMAARVMRGLGLQQQYAMKGNIRTSEAYASDMPFQWIIENIKDSLEELNYKVTIADNNQFQLNEDPTLYNFGQSVKLPGASFRLIPYGGITSQQASIQYVLKWLPELELTAYLSENLDVIKSEGASVLVLTYPVENTKVGLDIVNRYMKEYQLSSLEDKQLIAQTTAEFIDEQLDTLQRELGGVERNLQVFREKNNLISPEEQTGAVFNQLSETNKQIAEQTTKSKVLDYLTRYVSDEQNSNKVVPSNLGIEEPTLVQQITEINSLQLQRNALLESTTENNPLVTSITALIEQTRMNILQNLRNVKAAYQLSLNELNKINDRAEASIRSIPGKEKQLLEVTRRQSILQELYSFLLQKKLETGISSASTISDIKMLEPALADAKPVSPNKRSIYGIAALLGLALPVAIIFIIDNLNDKVTTRNDVVKLTNAPLLGEIGHVEDAQTLVLRKNNRSYVAEQFRILRSNLQYVIPKASKPVILVTSSFSGEGKSFISTNLGAVLALSGKKTVILEMDIRKPKIMKGLGMEERTGITNYLIGNTTISSIIVPVAEVDNLYVIPCGPIPPNPAEILLDEKVAILFAELHDKFDAIIVDSAPVGLVSDASTLGVYCNASVFIVRHNFTLKKQVPIIDSLYVEKKLPQLSIVINDIQKGFGGYYGYGYGYSMGNAGSGHGGYFEDGKKKGVRWFTGK